MYSMFPPLLILTLKFIAFPINATHSDGLLDPVMLNFLKLLSTGPSSIVQ